MSDQFTVDKFTVDASGLIENDQLVTCDFTISGGSGGATTASVSLQVNRADESTAIARAAQVLIVAKTAQYAPADARSARVTFTTASTGSIVASDTGWALIETNSVGAFACLANNASDESAYIAGVSAAGHSDPTDGVLVIGSESVTVTWAA